MAGSPKGWRGRASPWVPKTEIDQCTVNGCSFPAQWTSNLCARSASAFQNRAHVGRVVQGLLEGANAAVVHSGHVRPSTKQKLHHVSDASSRSQEKRRVPLLLAGFQIGPPVQQQPSELHPLERPVRAVARKVQTGITAWLRAGGTGVDDPGRSPLRQITGS